MLVLIRRCVEKGKGAKSSGSRGVFYKYSISGNLKKIEEMKNYGPRLLYVIEVHKDLVNVQNEYRQNPAAVFLRGLRGVYLDNVWLHTLNLEKERCIKRI